MINTKKQALGFTSSRELAFYLAKIPHCVYLLELINIEASAYSKYLTVETAKGLIRKSLLHFAKTDIVHYGRNRYNINC